MAKYTVIINVDEEQLRKIREENVGEEEAKDESIEFAIEQEMGWVNQSGISVESVNEKL